MSYRSIISKVPKSVIKWSLMRAAALSGASPLRFRGLMRPLGARHMWKESCEPAGHWMRVGVCVSQTCVGVVRAWLDVLCCLVISLTCFLFFWTPCTNFWVGFKAELQWHTDCM
jgi:hypothetical protein